jgi:primosomal protein N' (replication factor Y)
VELRPVHFDPDQSLFDDLERRLEAERPVQRTLVADVFLPLQLPGTLTYVLPPDWADRVQPGLRVLAPVGKSKIYTGIVARVRPLAEVPLPERKSLRPLVELLDDYPVCTHAQLALWQWMAEYYCCTPGEVIRAALPAALKLDSDLVVEAAAGVDLEDPRLTDTAYLILEAIQAQGSLTLTEAAEVLNLADARPRLKQLEEQGWVVLRPLVQERFVPKTLRVIVPAPAYASEAALNDALNLLQKAPSQERGLLQVAEGFLQRRLVLEATLKKTEGIGAGAVRALLLKGIVQVVEVPIDRAGTEPRASGSASATVFTSAQQRVWQQWQQHLATDPTKPFLLHGVTGSGKTHLYIEMIRQVMAQEQQALYLLPEISLTKQIIDRLRNAFGDDVGVYHSRFTDQERVEAWRNVLFRRYKVVVGARSSIFLPFTQFGLVVVDEEHDGSFKQAEPAPRYNARDVAVWYAHHLGIPIVLGSATPAIETYHSATVGKYALAQLPEPAVATVPNTLQVVDMAAEVKARTNEGEFSSVLVQALRETLARGEQAIVFKNRRGYSPFASCPNCGHVPHCIYCDIALTYHKQGHYLRCHYCGYTDNHLQKCQQCSHPELNFRGMGTERLEEHLQELLPDARIGRMDQDTTRGKVAFSRLIERFETQEIQVLVGTQMVTKGLDFERVTLAAVTDADRLLHWPDFRALENAYQLLRQFAGRAGRSTRPGKVVMQTYQPNHGIFQWLQQPYEQFCELQLRERTGPYYPPFGRLIRLEVRDRQPDYLHEQATLLAQLLREAFGNQVLGPEHPQVRRVRNQYRMFLLLKILPGQSPAKFKAELLRRVEYHRRQLPRKSLRVLVDVDPR